MKRITTILSLLIGLIIVISLAQTQTQAQTLKICSRDYMGDKLYVLHNSVAMSIMGAVLSILDPFEKEAPPEESNNGAYCLLEAFDVMDKKVSLYYHQVRGETKIHYVATVNGGEDISYFLVHFVADIEDMIEKPEDFPMDTMYSLTYRQKDQSTFIAGFYGEPSFRILKYMISLYLKDMPILSEPGISIVKE